MTRVTRHLDGRRLAGLAAGLVLTAGVAACSGDPDTDADATPQETASPTVSEASATATAGADEPVLPDDEAFGPQCRSAKRGMARWSSASDSTETALTRFFSSQRGTLGYFAGLLGRTKLYDEAANGGVTLLIPTQRAYSTLPSSIRWRLIFGEPAYREAFARRHLVQGRLVPSALEGEHQTLGDQVLPITVGAGDVRVGVQGARVLCGNLRIRRATVYILDAPLIA